MLSTGRASLSVPSVLRAAGYGLRPQCADDYAFLEQLYICIRASEVAQLDWLEEAKRTFLVDQCRLQHKHYQTHYYDAEFLIVERASKPVGRIYIFRGPHDYRVVDISLVPDVRGAGVGGALLAAVQAEASATGKTVSIHVENFNPARNLYRRLGFREIEEKGPYWLMEWSPV